MACTSMKSAASCEKQCELQDTLNIDNLNAYCGPGLVPAATFLSVPGGSARLPHQWPDGLAPGGTARRPSWPARDSDEAGCHRPYFGGCRRLNCRGDPCGNSLLRTVRRFSAAAIGNRPGGRRASCPPDPREVRVRPMGVCLRTPSGLPLPSRPSAVCEGHVCRGPIVKGMRWSGKNPPNLSILVGGGDEHNHGALSSCERKGMSSAPNPPVHLGRAGEMWCEGGPLPTGNPSARFGGVGELGCASYL